MMRAALKASGWRIAVVTLGVLILGAAGAVLFYISSEPDFLAGALTQLLGRRVEIAELEFHVGRSLEVELRGVRVFDADDKEVEGLPVFEVRRARGRQAWPRLLAGQFLPLEWVLQEPRLRGRALPKTDTSRRPSLPMLSLTIENGSVEWQQNTGPPILLRNIHVSASRSALSASLNGSATADLARAGASIGWLALDFRDGTDQIAIDGEFEGLQLAALPLPGPRISKGRADGHMSLQLSEAGIHGSVDVRISSFELPLPGLGKPLAPTEVHLQIDGDWSHGRLTLHPHPIRLDDLVLSGELVIEAGPRAHVRGTLMLDPFQLGRSPERLQLIRLMGLRHPTWARIDERCEEGWIDDLTVAFNLPLEGLDESLSFRRKLRPEEFSLIAHARDGVYRPGPDSKPLEAISADLEVHGNVLEVRRLHMERDGEPLIEIDLRLDGLHRLVRLPPEERRTPPGPGAPLHGLGPAFQALAQRGEADRPPARIHLTDFQIAYPAFVLPFRDVETWVSFPEHGVLIEDAEGVLGGAPARLSALWQPRKRHVRVSIEYLDSEAPPRRTDSGNWAEGHFEIHSLHLGRWHLTDARGSFRASHALLQIDDLFARVSDGELWSQGSISLGERGFAPFAFEIDLNGADAAQLSAALGFADHTLSGSGFVKGTLQGHLEPGHRFLDSAHVEIDVRLEKGTLGNLPATVVLARLPSIQGMGGLFGQPLPYDSIKGQFTIHEGKLRTEDFALQGPELRILTAGELDLRSEDLRIDMVVALLLLRTVDWVIEQLPIVGDLILGKDGNLFAVYVHLEGPWQDPRASLVAPDALQTPKDWATRVIGSGMGQLRKLFQLGFPRQGDSADEASHQTEDQ